MTPYTRNGPDGGLVCTPCGKQLAADEKTNDRKPAAKGGAGRKRRQVESNRLDGLIRVGAKPLQGLCIEKVAQHHTDIEEFGDLPEVLVDRLGQIFSKKRVLDPRTFKLFLRPDMQEIFVHDAASKFGRPLTMTHILMTAQISRKKTSNRSLPLFPTRRNLCCATPANSKILSWPTCWKSLARSPFSNSTAPI